MKKVFLFFASIALCFSVSAQSELTHRSGRVFQDGARLQPNQIREVMAINSEALAMYNSGRSLAVIGQVIAYPSAFLLGWDTGGRLSRGEGNNTLLAVSATGTAVGLILAFIGENRIGQSVSLYNSTVNNVSYQVKFGFTPSGIGFTVNF